MHIGLSVCMSLKMGICYLMELCSMLLFFSLKIMNMLPG